MPKWNHRRTSVKKKREGTTEPQPSTPEIEKLSPSTQAAHDVQMGMRLDRMEKDGTLEKLAEAFENGAMERIMEKVRSQYEASKAVKK